MNKILAWSYEYFDLDAMTSTSSLSTCVETSEPETDEEDIEGMDIETLKKKCKQLEKETREIECYLQENKQKIQQVNELTKILVCHWAYNFLLIIKIKEEKLGKF